MNQPPSMYTSSPMNQSADVSQPERPFLYEDEDKIFNTIEEKHAEEITKCDRRREMRKNRISVKELRDKKQILNDETVIPDRTIDTNVRREKTPYVKFIEQSTAVLSFADPAAPDVNFAPMQEWYTDLVRRGDWKMPFFKLIDCILLHGAGYMEVVYDPSQPCQSDKQYIRRDHMLLPPGTRDIQACTRFYRKYELTKQQLSELGKKLEFDPAELAKIVEHNKNSDNFIAVYKGFMKQPDGTVYIAYRGEKGAVCSTWLKAPAPLDLGLYTVNQQITVDPATGAQVSQPTVTTLPVKQYPVTAFPYHVEEDEVILDTQGRAALDLHVQDALTGLWSATVNGTMRASRFYPTRKAAMGETPKNKELFELRHGHVFEGDFSIFQPAYPNTIAMASAQALSTKKSQEIGAVDYAAMNRQDTAKTATELNLAQQEADSLGSVNISLFSRCWLQLELLAFTICMSRLSADLQLGVQPPKVSPPPTFDVQYMFSPTLVATMAADSQVVRRAMMQSKMLQYYGVVAGTPFQLPFLKDMLREMFPDRYARWEQAVGEMDQNKQMLGGAFEALKLMPAEAIPADQQQNFVQLLNQIGQTLNPEPQPK